MHKEQTMSKRRVRLYVECSLEEKQIIKSQARKFGKSISEYILELIKANISSSSNTSSSDDFWKTLGY